MATNFEIVGMKELLAQIDRLGKVPQVAVNKAAQKGATIARKAAKANAPRLTGALKRGIILKKERKTKPGKTVYDVMMNPAMNDIFVKVSKSGKRSYYPASQEYGFFTRDGGYVQGKRYLSNALSGNSDQIEKTVVQVLSDEIDKAISKG